MATKTDASQISFLFGAPLSGVRRLMHALNRHPRVCATEFQLFGSYLDARPSPQPNRLSRMTLDRYAQSVADGVPLRANQVERRDFLQNYIRGYLEFITTLTRETTGKQTLVDAIVPFPGTSRRIIDSLTEYFPQSRIVYLLRDGRDVATEATFESLSLDSHGTDRYAFFVEDRPHTKLRRFFDDRALRTAATTWNEAVSVQTRLDENVLTIRYDQLEAQPQQSMELVLDHLRIAGELPASLAATKRGQLTERAATLHFKERFVHEDAIWPTFFTEADGRLFEEVAGRQLRRAGFEENDRWVQQLPSELNLQTS